jgi:hypothetical protein
MSGVLSQGVGRQDVLLHRGMDERLGVRWQQRTGASGYEDVDLLGWSGEFVVTSSTGEEWYSQALPSSCFTSDGYAIAEIPASAFAEAVWAARSLGEWRMTGVSADGRRHEVLAWGYAHIA